MYSNLNQYFYEDNNLYQPKLFMLNILLRRVIFFIYILTIISVHSAFSQQNNFLINSGELIKKASELHDKKEYKKAIEIYKQINRSDTNYSNTLYELSLTSYADSQYDNALQYAKEGLKLFPEDFARFHDSELKKWEEVVRFSGAKID